MEDRRQEQRKHVFAINGSPELLNLIRDLFQAADEAARAKALDGAPVNKMTASPAKKK